MDKKTIDKILEQYPESHYRKRSLGALTDSEKYLFVKARQLGISIRKTMEAYEKAFGRKVSYYAVRNIMVDIDKQIKK